MKTARLHRLFNPRTGRCFDVALDHGFFNEGSFLAGIENLPSAVATLVAAAPDAIQLTVGQAPHLQGPARPRQARPRAAHRRRQCLRDAATAHPLLAHDRGRRRAGPAPRRGLRRREPLLHPRPAGARRPVHPEHPPAQARMRPLRACRSWSSRSSSSPTRRPAATCVDGDPAKIIPLVRQAVELGADIIKADPTDDVSALPPRHRDGRRRPVLVRGGGRAPEDEILARTAALLQQGASGIVYGTEHHPAPAAGEDHPRPDGRRPRGRASPAAALAFLK